MFLETFVFISLELIVLVALIPFAILFYFRAVGSRKIYQCVECGEQVQVELMDASSCVSCGSALRFMDKNAQEKLELEKEI